MTVTVRMEWPLKDWPNPNRSRRKHWAQNGADAKAVRTAAGLLATQALAKCEPLRAPIAMHLAIAYPDARRRDLLNTDTKALVDGICDSGLVEADDWQHMPHVTITHDPERSPKGQLRVTVTLAEIPVDEPHMSPGMWDNRATTKNGPNVTGALTPQSGPNAYQGGASMNHSRPTPTPSSEGGA